MERNGGRPKKETNGFENKITNGYENIKTETKPNVNENVNVNVNENANDNVVGDSCVDGLQKIIDFYNTNIGLITPYGLETLEDYSKEMPAELIIFAMKKAVEADKRTIQYIKGILNNWSKKGIKTMIEVQKEDEQFKKENKKNTKVEARPEQREYAKGELSKLYANLGGITNE